MAKKDPETRKIEEAQDGWTSFGGNLYLRVDDGGRRKRWIVKVVRQGKKRELGCGSLATTTIRLARERRDLLMSQLADGLDPAEEKRKAREANAKPERKRTFAEAAEQVLKARSTGWKKSWEDRSTSEADWIKSYVKDAKALRSRPIDEIDVDDIKKVVAPFWDKGQHVTARRLLNRIELAIEYALAHGWRTGDNPAAWRRFQFIAPAQPKNGKKHHAAVPWKDMPEFMAKLRAADSIVARCLEFLILTATRSGEARGARWTEVNMSTATWSIPAERMKAEQDHDVPLSRQALDLLRRLNSAGIQDGLIFPSDVQEGPLDLTAILKLAKRLGGEAMTVHGFRTSARTFWGDHGVDRELAEMNLAHRIGSAVAQAYNRTSLLERRRASMQQWSDFLDGKAEAGKVTKFRGR
jgi:integrase